MVWEETRKEMRKEGETEDRKGRRIKREVLEWETRIREMWKKQKENTIAIKQGWNWKDDMKLDYMIMEAAGARGWTMEGIKDKIM